MAATRLAVAPDVLRWARVTAGLDMESASRRMQVSYTTLERWESGDLAPTVVQLRKAARAYNRPLAALLLPEPPDLPQPVVTDFRRMDDEDVSAWSPQLRAAIQRAMNQRAALVEIEEAAPYAVALGTYDLSLSPAIDGEKAGSVIRGFTALDRASPNVMGRPDRLLSHVISAVETAGVLVTQTQRVEIAEMRGFSIAETPYPVVGLNGSDWPRPKLFTLLHELSHIALRSSGLCDLHEIGRPRKPKSSAEALERRCNQIAAAALMPEHRFRYTQESLDISEAHLSVEDLGELASNFGASSEAALLRLISLRVVGWDAYRRLKPQLNEAYEEAMEARRRRQAESEGGPSYYVMKTRDLGRAYVSTVVNAFEEDLISSRDVTDYLGVRFDQLGKLTEVVSG